MAERRLCIVVHGPYPVGEPRVEQQARVAQDRGFAVEVVAARRGGEPRHEIVDDVKVTRLPVGRVRGRGVLAAAAESAAFTASAVALVGARSARRPYDVVQIANPPDWLLAAALVPRARGARVIFDVHDLSRDMFGMRFGQSVLARSVGVGLRAVEGAAVRAADVVLTVHEPYRRELIAHGVDARKVVVVMNSPDETLLPKEPPQKAENRFRIVYHGTITPHYGVELLVRAAGRIRDEVDVEVELCGDGDALEAALRLAGELGLTDRIRTTRRYVPKADALRIAASASVGVIPNLPITLNRYALSSKLLDFVALGVPVVAADLPTIREHFDADEVRYFAAGDSDALADALLEVARNPDAAKTRVAKALVRYESYRWSLNAERYARVLDGTC